MYKAIVAPRSVHYPKAIGMFSLGYFWHLWHALFNRVQGHKDGLQGRDRACQSSVMTCFWNGDIQPSESRTRQNVLLEFPGVCSFPFTFRYPTEML
jgi:hypothetical protein